MADYHDLVQALTWLLVNKLQNKSEYTRGLLGNGQGQVEVPDRPDYTYVRPDRFTTRVAEIFNKSVGGPDGLPVILGELPWSPGLTQVLSVDWDTYLGVGWGESTPGIAQHGQTHEWRDGAPGVDAFNVYRRQMGELRCYPVGSGSTSIYVSPYNFTHMESLKSWSGLPGLDLSGAIPSSSGTARMALVYWDPCSGTAGWLGVATGTLGVDSEAEILNRPAAPAGTIPSAWVRLAGGQGSITEFDIWDARPLWQPSLEFATGSCGIWAGIIPIGDPGNHFTGSTVEAALDELGTSGGGGSPAGADTQIQFNDAGSFGGDAALTWDKASSLLTVDASAAPVLLVEDNGVKDNVLYVDTAQGRVSINTTPTSGDVLTISGGNVTLDNNESIRFFDTGGLKANILKMNGADELIFGDSTGRSDAFRLYTAGVQALFIGVTQLVGIDNTNPQAKVHVDQKSTTAGVPVLLLDQADVSEEFIRFVGTAATGTLTQSIVDDADVTTAVFEGWLEMYIQDDGNQITDQSYYVPAYTLA